MQNMRSAFANLFSLAAYAGATALAGGLHQQWSGLLAFQLIILFVSHEAWYWCLNTQGFIVGIIRAFNKKEAEPAFGEWTYRLSTLSLLLAPHVLYSVAFAAHILLPGLFTGLKITPALFLCSYVGMFALWAASILLHAAPLSLERLFDSRALSPTDHIGLDSPPAKESRPLTNDAPLPMERQSALTAALEEGEEVLCTIRPDAAAQNHYARAKVLWGNIAAVIATVSFLIALNGYGSYMLKHDTRYLILCGLCGILALIFCRSAWSSHKEPARWSARLSRISYAITTRRIFLFDGADTQTYELSPELNLIYESLPNADLCIIHISRPSLLSRATKKVFGSRAQVINATYTPAPSGPLSGLYHVPSSLHALVLEQCAAHARRPDLPPIA